MNSIIPEQFKKNFDRTLFTKCDICFQELITEKRLYTIFKFYQDGECLVDMAMCDDCAHKLYKAYSTKSLKAMIDFYPSQDTWLRKQLLKVDTLRTGEVAKLVENYTNNCIICDTDKGSTSSYLECAHGHGDSLVIGHAPYMQCENCMSELYNKLSKKTVEAYNRFMRDSFGLPPDIIYSYSTEDKEIFYFV